MSRWMVFLIAWAGGVLGVGQCRVEASPSVEVCNLYHEVYKNEIKAKILAGIPFELMSVVFEDGRLIEKKAIRVTYNLWDEVVTIKTGDKTLSRVPLAAAEDEVCRFLEIGGEIPPGHKCVYKLLLNPLWGERITRLQVASNGPAGGPSGRLVEINWQKLANEMPSDKVLLEREIVK